LPEAQGDLVAALLDKLEVARAGVMAVSGGGPAALQFGVRHPDRCKGLVLVATCADKVQTPIPLSFKVMKFLARWPFFVERFRRKAEGDLVGIAKRSIADAEILERTVENEEVWPLFSALMLSTYDRMGQRLDGTGNDILITATATYPLEKLSVPVLVVHGTSDRLVDYTLHTGEYLKRIANAELYTVQDGEHVAIFTHRADVRERVAAFAHRWFDV
jgi:pimeloyl-ACP methyl ester carboxylesterase